MPAMSEVGPEAGRLRVCRAHSSRQSSDSSAFSAEQHTAHIPNSTDMVVCSQAEANDSPSMEYQGWVGGKRACTNVAPVQSNSWHSSQAVSALIERNHTTMHLNPDDNSLVKLTPVSPHDPCSTKRAYQLLLYAVVAGPSKPRQAQHHRHGWWKYGTVFG